MSDDPISDELSPFVPDIFEKLDSTLPFPQKTGIDRAAWDKFVDISMPEGSQKIDRQTFDSLSPSDKNRSRILRRQYFIKAGPFFPPSYKAILDELQDIALVGLEMSEGIRMGAVITGLPTTGKTTITRAFGKKWHLSRKTAHMLEYGCDDTVRGEGLWDFVPVVYIDLRGTSTWEGLLQSIAIFYRIPDYQALNEAELLELVIEYINECGTSLIIIDDIHYLNFDLKGKENINNNLQ